GWRVDIKSESQLAEEEAYQSEEWAQGEWVVDAETGEQVWVPADGGEAVSAEEWAASETESDLDDVTATDGDGADPDDGDGADTADADDLSDQADDVSDVSDVSDEPVEAAGER